MACSRRAVGTALDEVFAVRRDVDFAADDHDPDADGGRAIAIAPAQPCSRLGTDDSLGATHRRVGEWRYGGSVSATYVRRFEPMSLPERRLLRAVMRAGRRGECGVWRG